MVGYGGGNGSVMNAVFLPHWREFARALELEQYLEMSI